MSIRGQRLIDSKLWERKWFRELSLEHKLFWLYLMVKCDHNGLWDGDLELASFQLGVVLDRDEIQSAFKGKIRSLFPNPEWCVPALVGKKNGDMHWNWKGGITPVNQRLRHSEEYNNWRRRVFSRDGFTCQYCGVVGAALVAHHIKPFAEYPELRLDISNGITLCRDCHIEEHTGRGEEMENE